MKSNKKDKKTRIIRIVFMIACIFSFSMSISVQAYDKIAVRIKSSHYEDHSIAFHAMSGNWARTYGDSGTQNGGFAQPTPDGGFVLLGSGTGTTFFVIKADQNGTIQWQKSYVGPSMTIAGIQPVGSTGYVVGGNGTVINNYQGYWIIELDLNGNVTNVTGKYDNMVDQGAAQINSMQRTSTGGVVYACTISHHTAPGSPFDCYAQIAGALNAGLYQQEPSNSSCGWVSLYHVSQTADGGFIAGGLNYGFNYIIIFKLSSSGSMQWSKSYYLQSCTDSSGVLLKNITELTGGGYAAIGTCSNIGTNMIVVRFDADGNMLWQKRYGPVAYNAGRFIQPTTDGGIIIAGTTTSFGAGGTDIWLLKIDSDGNIIWQKTYGGTGGDYIASFEKTADGQYLIGGNTNSFGAGGSDLWVLKIDPNGAIGTSCSLIHTSSVAPPVIIATQVATPPAAALAGLFSYPGSVTAQTVLYTSSLLCSDSLAPGAVPDGNNYSGVPLLISKSGASLQLTWSPPGGTCSTSDYGIYRGSLPWTNYNHSSLLCTTSSATQATIDPETDSYYYLIVAQSAGKEGSYGIDSTDTQRPIGATPCLPQELGFCN